MVSAPQQPSSYPTPQHTGCLSRREVNVTLKQWQLLVVFHCALFCVFLE